MFEQPVRIAGLAWVAERISSLGQIPALRIGRRILIPKAALERLLEQSASAAEHDHTRIQ